MNLRKAFLRAELRQPNSRKFDPGAVQAFLRSLPEITPNDASLAFAAEVIGEQIGMARTSIFRTIDNAKIHRKDLILSMTAAANKAYAEIYSEDRDSPFVGSARVDSIGDILFDSAQLALFDITNRGLGLASRAQSVRADVDVMISVFNAYQTITVLNQMWQLCLFFGWRLDQRNQSEFHCFSLDPDLEAMIVASRFLKDQVLGGYFAGVANEARARAASLPAVQRSRAISAMMHIARKSLLERDYSTTLDEAWEQISPNRERDQFWRVLEAISFTIFEQVHELGDDHDAYARTFLGSTQFEVLTKDVQKHTGLAPFVIRHWLKMLVQNWSEPQDVWERLFLDMGGGRLCFFAAPLLAPNDSRFFGKFLSSHGVRWEVTGTGYERMVRDHITALFRDDPFFRNDYVHPTRLERFGQEIDLLFRIGNTVYIGEVKCRIFPGDIFALFQFGDRVIKTAVDQAQRKADAAVQDSAALRALTRYEGAKALTVQPVVVTNQYAFCGYRTEGVPITNFSSLFEVLAKREILFNVKANERGDLIADCKVDLCADGPENFSETLLAYIGEPIEERVFRSMCAVKTQGISLISGATLTHEMYVISPPETDAAVIDRVRGFAATIPHTRVDLRAND